MDHSKEDLELLLSERTQFLQTTIAELEETLFAMSQAGVGLVRIAPDTGKILSVNQHMADRLGYSQAELAANMKISDVQRVHPQVIRDRIQQVKRHGSHRFEAQLIARDGTLLPVEVFAYYHYGFLGDDCIIGFITDTSHRKEAEEKIQLLNAELRDMNHLQVARQTVAALAHELNQPLNAVASYAGAALKLLEAGRFDDPKLVHALKSSAEQALLAGGVVHKLQALLDQAKAETQCVHLDELLRHAVERSQVAQSRQLTLALRCEPGQLQVKVNQLQIELVLINLLRNSMEALRQQRTASPRIDIVAVRLGAMASIKVCDNGPGISPEDVDRIFDPFFSTKPTGSGMGLAVSRAIVETHGGKLWVDDQTAAGTCFHLTLPLAN